MIHNIIICFFPLLLIVLPMWLYRSKRSFMAKFYLAMLRSGNTRKFYAHMLFFFLLLFHYVFVCGHSGDYGTFFSTIFIAVLWSKKRAMRWLSRLHEDRHLFVGISLLTMAIAAIPHLYTLSMSLAFLLLAATFYPSMRAMYAWQDDKTRLYWMTFPEVVYGYYY